MPHSPLEVRSLLEKLKPCGAIRRPHWSYSALQQYLRCPLQYYFQRILGLPSRKSTSELALGSAVHATLASFHSSIQAGETSTSERLQRVFRESLAAEYRRSMVRFRPGQTKEDVFDQGWSLISCYLEQPPPANILGIEITLLSPLLNSRGAILETPVVVVLDLVVGTDSGVEIVEFKTTSKVYSQLEVDLSLQPGFYLGALQQLGVSSVSLRYGLMVKTKKPKYVERTTNRDLEQFCRLGDVVEQIETGIQNRVFFPIASAMNCSNCSYIRECKDWKSGSNGLGEADSYCRRENKLEEISTEAELADGISNCPSREIRNMGVADASSIKTSRTTSRTLSV